MASSRSYPNPMISYDVFISFCGKDTQSFVSHLYTALINAELVAFMEDEKVSNEENVSVSVVRAIECSIVSIIIISRDYLNSERCLQELEKIMECRRSRVHYVFPVFFDVDPLNAVKMVDEVKLRSWMAALNEATNILGLELIASTWKEGNAIGDVVTHVVRLHYYATNMLVALATSTAVKSRVQDVIGLLNCQQSKPLLIGLWGMTGIGKTTIAKALFGIIGHRFEGMSFLENLSDRFKTRGEYDLVHQLASEFLEINKMNADSLEKKILKERCRQKNILLVLDGVDQLNHVKALCGIWEWFGPLSVVVITTIDRYLLRKLGADLVYTVNKLDENESIELLRAFKETTAKEDFVELSESVLSYCQGLPLALKAFGSSLHTSSKEFWRSEISRLQTVPDEIRSVLCALELSYDELNSEEKAAFLNIACFFVGKDRTDVIHRLNISAQDAELVITALEDKAHVTIDGNDKLRLHPLLQLMGRKIVEEKSRVNSEQKTYDVFLSFRGQDTRASFVSHLYASLQNAGIHIFKDDDEIQRGDNISTSLLQGIGSSKISVIILSRNYANSRWCMTELENIVEKCKTIVPIFYRVDPSEVRHQRGDFGEAFEDLIRSISVDQYKVTNWRRALLEVGSRAGFVVFNSRNESEDIKKVVDCVTKLLDNNDLFVADHPVGIESRVQDVIQLLNSQQSKVMVGIWGMGGIGKTSIAKATYNHIRRNFEAKSILLNVREAWEENNGQVSLQQRLLSDIYKTMNIKIESVESGKMILKERLRQKRIFLVLDDVSKLDQMKALCGSCDWFGEGSRIVITTRDESLLRSEFGVNHVYNVKVMNENESLELFSWHAFKQPTPREGFAFLSSDVVKYSGGLPLALQVIGSFLNGCNRMKEWHDVLKKLKIIPDAEILTKLKISFDGLCDDDVKEIFLDIAFFFIGMNRDEAIEILNACGHFAEIGIRVLTRQSLLSINEKNKIGMHDLLRDMGREIVRQQSPNKIQKRSRLWLEKDVHAVLSRNIGPISVEGLSLRLPRMDATTHFETKAFEKMDKLRLLQLAGIQLKGDYKYLSRDLRWLCWHGFPLKCAPTICHQRSLVAIDFKYSNLERIWKKSQPLEKLKFLNLSHSPNLRQTPDFKHLPNLEKLILKDCPELSLISDTIGHLDKIELINLKNCTKLRELPRSIYKLKSLKTLILSGCTKVEKLEEDLELMESLTTLIADKTGITKVPFAIVKSKSIGYISLCGFEGFSHNVFPSIVLSWMSPTNNILSHVQISMGTPSLAFSDEENNNDRFHGLSSILKDLQELQRLWVKCDSEVQLNQLVEKILGSLYIIPNCEATPGTSYGSNIRTSTPFGGHDQVHNSNTKHSLTSLLFQIGMNCQATHILKENILQKMPPIGSGFLPNDNFPDWLTFSCGDSSVMFEVPQLNGRNLKTILCVVYYSSAHNVTLGGLKIVMVINYTKNTIMLYKKDALVSFEDDNEEWQKVVSNIEGGNKVKFVVVFENGFTVKRTTIYLIFEEPPHIDQKNAIGDGDENRFGRIFIRLPSLVRRVLVSRPFWFGLAGMLACSYCCFNKQRCSRLISRKVILGGLKESNSPLSRDSTPLSDVHEDADSTRVKNGNQAFPEGSFETRQ